MGKPNELFHGYFLVNAPNVAVHRV